LSSENIKVVGRAQGATVNDVMLAAVAGGLRRYLALHGGEVDEVIWMVPVNLKPFEDSLPADDLVGRGGCRSTVRAVTRAMIMAG
jgi:diacylglycerol O-acyltransferase